MKIGMVGLGRMGFNMARRLLDKNVEVAAFNRTRAKTDELAALGGEAAYSLSGLVEKLAPPRAVWLMLPAGRIVDVHLVELAGLLSDGDIVIEGGNTNYLDDAGRAEALRSNGIHYLDVGVSGGIWGYDFGYCLMIGGPREAYEIVEPVFRALAPKEGYLYCGPTGAGHFVKMIHNGIEYGLMQAYAEGFELLEASPYAQGLDYAQLAHLWNQGSVIRSWLLELAEAAFAKSGRLEDIAGRVADSGEGRWTVDQAVRSGVSAPVITLSLMERFRSRRADTFGGRVVAALRREFGGHEVNPSQKEEG